MRSAAVGFQCPNCVAEGSKQTRSGRTAYGGERSGNPALTSQVLIAINAAVWIAILSTGGYSSRLFELLALQPKGGPCKAPGNQYFPDIHSASTCAAVGGDWVRGVSDGAAWQLVSHMFVHVEPWHIGFNMLALWFLGPQLELAIGRIRFLALYFGSGLAGAALVYWAGPLYGGTHGASGAIFGLMGALLIIAFKVRGNTQEILMWIGINFAITVVGRGSISWQGHLGGFLGGLVLMGLIAYAPRDRRTFWQVSGFVAFGVVLAAAIVARTLALS
jgi:membrane associated rhomboid family serine protease